MKLENWQYLVGPQSSSMIHSWGSRGGATSVKQRAVDLHCPGRAESRLIPVLSEAPAQKRPPALATPGASPAGAFHLSFPALHTGVDFSVPPGALSLPRPPHNRHLCSVSPTPRAGRLGTPSCSYLEQMVLIKGANESQAPCDCTGRAGGQARQSLPPMKIPESQAGGRGPSTGSWVLRSP